MSTTNELIAGALFDFLGCLTTLKEPITLGSTLEPHRVLDVLGVWADERGLSLDEADVEHWHERIDPEPHP